MGFAHVRFYQYRNLVDAEVPLGRREVFLVGENGQGKSNFLESVYLSSFGSSFRTNRDSELVRHGCAEALVEAVLGSGGDQTRIVIRTPLRGKKEILMDGKPLPDRKLLIRTIPTVVFCHNDMEYVTGPPERRRWFFNQTQSLFDPLFIDILRRYRRALKSRNAALRDHRVDLLPALDQQLAATGVEIQRRRQRTAAEFSSTFAPIYAQVSGLDQELGVSYIASWKEPSLDTALGTLGRARSRDQVLQTTTTGPHRDDFRFLAAGRDFSRFASTGQCRLLALVLRSAQASYCARQAGRGPVLLLDDVLLELDAPRRERFLGSLPRYNQAFFTFLPDERFLDYRRPETLIYDVSAGKVRPWKEPATF